MKKQKKASDTSKKKEKLWFDELSMKEVENASKKEKVLIFPIGSIEEHGEHLPLCTDSLQPEHVALKAANKTKSLIAPPLRYGVCNSTRNFPGTISISFESLYKIARDILKEFIRNGFMRILVLSGHVGQSHLAALKLAAQEVVREQVKECPENNLKIMVCSDYDFAYELKGKYFDEKDGHAGTIETSRVMAIRPDLIKGKGKKSYPKLPRFQIVADPERYFPTGVIGDPTTASPKIGQKINKYVINEVIKLIKELKK